MHRIVLYRTSFMDLVSQNTQVILMSAFCLGCTLYICNAEVSDLSRRLPRMMTLALQQVMHQHYVFYAAVLSSKFPCPQKTITQ